MIGKISQQIANSQININNLTNRSHKDLAYTLIDLDDLTEESSLIILEKINNINEVIRTRIIKNPYL
ncbi:D-3-phosphoglycerate dehydrogenase [Salmonella enterica subsp. enterica serovar Anatum]|nr:D-3-phosphoglycerate dehydrogenase [Salmonella enterica subsp. enterica serovar Anatum]